MSRSPAAARHPQGLPIAEVEKEVGIAKDRLRKWEQRYGFPAPLRDDQGKRVYPQAQVDRLRTIRRLIDSGHSVRHVMAQSEQGLAVLARGESVEERVDPDVLHALELLRSGALQAFDRWLRTAMLRDGLERFALGTGRDLLNAVDRAWNAGELRIWQEHLFSERFSALLMDATAAAVPAVPGQGVPVILLATPSGERHGLGLAMVHALFVGHGAVCISLGTDVPNSEIAAAAAAVGADVVALSTSHAYPVRRSRGVFTHLRELLPAAMHLWIGGGAGEALSRKRGLQGVEIMSSLEDGLQALDRAVGDRSP